MAPALRLQTLGGFRAWRDGVEIAASAWGREKAVHLFQLLITLRRQPMHKEEIIDRLWPSLAPEAGDRDFKVALNAIAKALEPERLPRASPRFVRRFDLAYALNLDEVWLDAEAFEAEVVQGNQLLATDQAAAITHYQSAVTLYAGDYLPERHYEDWTSAERERLQTLALTSLTTLADLLLEANPLESLRLTQRVLALDPLWENAYRTQMRAYWRQGNRALALRTFDQCAATLQSEFGLAPLPETQALADAIRGGTA
jgi:DNA-binding SARP family transcriptional activator